MNKWIKENTRLVGFAILAALLIPAAIVTAQTLSDTITRDVTPWYGEDQSSYATQNSRFGTIVRHYRYDTHGGAIGTINLGAALPNGALILGGVVDIDTFCTNTDGSDTEALGIVTATDILAAGVLLESNATTSIAPDPSNPFGTAVKVVDATTYVTLTIAGSANTAGNFSVYLYYIQSNP